MQAHSGSGRRPSGAARHFGVSATSLAGAAAERAVRDRRDGRVHRPLGAVFPGVAADSPPTPCCGHPCHGSSRCLRSHRPWSMAPDVTVRQRDRMADDDWDRGADGQFVAGRAAARLLDDGPGPGRGDRRRLGGSQFTETGEVAAIGLFGSKNNFALHISQMLFVCVAVLADAKQGRLFRFIALVRQSAAGPLLLWRAKSVGALAVFLPSLLLMCAIVGDRPNAAAPSEIAVAGSLVVAWPWRLRRAGGDSVEGRPAAFGRQIRGPHRARTALAEGGCRWSSSGRRSVSATRHSGCRATRRRKRSGGPNISKPRRLPFPQFLLSDAGRTRLRRAGIGAAALVVTISRYWCGACKPGPESGFFCAMMLFLSCGVSSSSTLGGFDLTALILPVAWLYATTLAGNTARSTPSCMLQCER